MASVDGRVAHQLNGILRENEKLSEWLIYGRTVLCQKDTTKGTAADNYCLIHCLPIMWKFFTGIMSDYLYEFLKEELLIPEKKKGCKNKDLRGQGSAVDRQGSTEGLQKKADQPCYGVGRLSIS